eukprot:g7801.t1
MLFTNRQVFTVESPAGKNWPPMDQVGNPMTPERCREIMHHLHLQELVWSYGRDGPKEIEKMKQQRSFTMPSVRPGDLVEVKYELSRSQQTFAVPRVLGVRVIQPLQPRTPNVDTRPWTRNYRYRWHYFVRGKYSWGKRLRWRFHTPQLPGIMSLEPKIRRELANLRHRYQMQRAEAKLPPYIFPGPYHITRRQTRGCVRKRLPLDLTPSVSCRHTDAYLLKHNGLKNFQTIVEHLEEKSDKYAKSCQQASWLNRKCKRREAQMFNAVKFIARAPLDQNFMSQLDEHERAVVSDAFTKTLKSLASSEEEGQQIDELLRKMKGHTPELLQDPQGTTAKVVGLMLKLVQGSPEEKETARKEISAMPETVPALSAEDEAKAKEKIQDMEKEFEEHRGEMELAMDQVDTKTNEAVEEEALEENDAGSALLTIPEDNNASATTRSFKVPIIQAVISTAVATILIAAAVSTFPVVGALLLYLTFGLAYCSLDDNLNETNDLIKCMGHIILAPLTAVKFLAKGLWRITKKTYRLIRGKKKTSDPSEPGARSSAVRSAVRSGMMKKHIRYRALEKVKVRPRSLVQICLQRVAENFLHYDNLYLKLGRKQLEDVYAMLDLDMPLPEAALRISDENYWKRRTQAKHPNAQVEKHGMSWKQTYLELELQQALEAVPITVEYGNPELEALKQQVMASRLYIYQLHITQFPSHLDLSFIFDALPALCTFSITYGNKRLGMDYERAMFGMKISDASA